MAARDDNGFNVSDRTVDILLEQWRRSPAGFLFHLDDAGSVARHFRDSVNMDRFNVGLDLVRARTGLAGKTLLELGAGYGGAGMLADREGARYTGIESSLEIHAVGRSFLEDNGAAHLDYRLGDGCRTGLPEGSMDVVLSVNVLEHVADVDAFVREGVRVLAPGGWLIFSFPNYDSVFEGHAGVPWLPWISRRMPYLHYRLCGLDRGRARRLCATQNFVTRGRVQKALDAAAGEFRFQVAGWGKDVFAERMRTYRSLPIWSLHNLALLKGMLDLADRFGLIRLATAMFTATGVHTPLVLALQKR